MTKTQSLRGRIIRHCNALYLELPESIADINKAYFDDLVAKVGLAETRLGALLNYTHPVSTLLPDKLQTNMAVVDAEVRDVLKAISLDNKGV